MPNPTKKIFTIGFTKRNAEQFFTKLQKNSVKRIVDVRLKNTSQLAGFAKSDDLKYFLNAIARIDYVHRPDLAPTNELLKGFKSKDISWDQYSEQYLALAQERKIDESLDDWLHDGDCLMCSERIPTHCHRKLLAEFIQKHMEGIEVCHL